MVSRVCWRGRAVVAAMATFAPCYVFTVLPAPHFRRLSRNRAVRAFIDGVSAAATGAIAGAATSAAPALKGNSAGRPWMISH